VAGVASAAAVALRQTCFVPWRSRVGNTPAAVAPLPDDGGCSSLPEQDAAGVVIVLEDFKAQAVCLLLQNETAELLKFLQEISHIPV
jgi:hypothetical protein